MVDFYAKNQKHLEWLMNFNPKKLTIWPGCKDISPLRFSLRLKELSLSGCSDITDMRPLASLKIKKLDLGGCKDI